MDWGGRGRQPKEEKRTKRRRSMENKPAVEELEASVHAQQLSSFSVFPMVLNTATDLGVFDVLVGVDEPGAYLSAREVAAGLAVGTDHHPDAPAMLDRMLCLLASHEVIACTLGADDDRKEDTGPARTRRYRAKPVCRYLTKNEGGVNMASFMQDRVLMESWYHLKDAVIDGEVAFDKAHGMMTLFEYLGKDPRLNRTFQLGHVQLFHQPHEQSPRFSLRWVRKCEDVGRCRRRQRRQPWHDHLQASVHQGDQLRPPPCRGRRPNSAGSGACQRRHVRPCPERNAMLLKNVLHDWNDEYCIKLLRNCWAGLPENGKVIVIEALPPLLPDSRLATKCTLQMDLFMLANTVGGRERTEEQYGLLAMKTGFSDFKMAADVENIHVMEFVK